MYCPKCLKEHDRTNSVYCTECEDAIAADPSAADPSQKDEDVTLNLHSFSEALAWLKDGKRASREGWNGKNMFIELQRPDENSKMTLPYLFIEYPDGRRCPWLASQTDLLENDWLEAIVI